MYLSNLELYSVKEFFNDKLYSQDSHIKIIWELKNYRVYNMIRVLKLSLSITNIFNELYP